MPRRRVAAGADRLATMVAALDAERALDAAPAALDEPPQRPAEERKRLVRDAGRAAVEEALLIPAEGVKRRAAELTSAKLTAEWAAYAQIYGTNGLASSLAFTPVQGIELVNPSANRDSSEGTETYFSKQAAFFAGGDAGKS